jgi:surfeit locus 1 family protein
MRLRIANRVFAPRLWATLATAALLAAFVSLGAWQLARGREKQALVTSFERGQQTTTTLGGGSVDALPRYQRISVAGHYDPARQILLDNMPSKDGLPGYRVLTPFVRAMNARLLLVDRGWVPLGVSRTVLPDVAVSPVERTVAGRLDQLPVPGVRVGAAGVEGDRHWPRVLNFPRQLDVERALGAPVESRVLLLDPEMADGYERAWHPALGFGPERHVGYAIQWFAFAVVLLVIFVALSLDSAASAEEGSVRP